MRPLCAIALFLPVAHCMKIAIMQPGPSASHFLFAHRLGETLAQLNHTVFIWSPRADYVRNEYEPPGGVEEYEIPYKLTAMQQFMTHVFNASHFALDWDVMQKWESEWFDACEEQYLRRNDKIDDIRRRKFDAAIAHSFDACPLMLAERMGIENVVWEMAGTYIVDFWAKMHGIPTNPSYIPNWMSANQDRMAFSARITNTLWGVLMSLGEYMPSSLYNRQCDMHSAAPDYDRPHCYRELGRRVNGILVNGERALDFPRPLFHTVQYLGAHDDRRGAAASKLDHKWAALLSEEKGRVGTILMSFGSLVNTDHIPQSVMAEIVSALCHFSNYTIVWKVTNELPSVAHEHIHFTKWMPQNDILAHHRTALFITHAGYNSLLEGASHGVPLLMVPFFADQHSNANRALRLGLGLVVQKGDITAVSMVDAMRTLLDDKAMKSRGKSVARMYGDRLVEQPVLLHHNVRLFSKAHLNTVYNMRHIRSMPLYTYLSLDIIALWGMLLALVLYAVCLVSLYGIRILFK